MALPTSTVNGATATINGIVYTYNSTKGAWYKQSTASTSVPVTISGTLSVSGNANVGNLGSPTVVNGNSNVTVTANGAVSISANGAVRVTIDANGNVGIGTSSTTEKMVIAGNILPSANITYNLGSATARWSTVYTGDLELSNGIGDYTIVEGEDDLFLYNNRSGKTYRFMLQEVDPAIVPPKKGT